jgi:hypothetical protein
MVRLSKFLRRAAFACARGSRNIAFNALSTEAGLGTSAVTVIDAGRASPRLLPLSLPPPRDPC